MSTTSLGGTTPPGLFDDQPEAVLFDPDGTVTNVAEQLKPFGSIVHIIKNDQDFHTFLQTKQRNTVISILIFSRHTRDDIVTFINNHLRRVLSVHSFYLFFTNGQQHAQELRNLLGPLLMDCYSITDHLYSEIRDIISTVCDLNAKFCYRRKKEEEAKSNNSLVFIYERQRRERLRLQIVNNTGLISEIDEDHL